MTINKTIKMLTKEVSYNNGTETVTACTMHPITPHDLATILVKAGNNLDGIMKAWDKLEIPAVNPASGAKRTTEETAEILLDRAPEVIGLIAQYAPELIADIIAISARAPEEGVAQYIQENWSLPLQFDCLRALAEVTFVSPEGFLEFVGKAMALGQVGKAIVRPSAAQEQPKTNRRRTDSAAG